MEHTLGPWEWRVHGSLSRAFLVGKAADHVLAIDETDVGVFPGRADADLIAEAPNLLKACLEAKRAIEQGCKAGAKARVERDERIIAILGNAIARATP